MKYCTVCKTKYEDGTSFCPVDGEVLEDDPTSLVGTNLDGQYRIESLLGQGGMGAVYKAHHVLLGDQVAIKVLPPEMRSNAEWLRRFQREGQAARRFRHPNAVTVYDLRTTSDGMIYMVMEYVEGQTLDAELKARGRMTPMQAFALLEPVMSVLNAAHAVGVVHRDLKPENIMIGKPGPDGSRSTKLLDLGIAKISDLAGNAGSGSTSLTMVGQILGTPYYMSPEQWGEMSRDGNPDIDGRADIYSLGAVFYQLVSGRRPFEAQTLQEIRRVHVFSAPAALSEIVPDIPDAFSTVIMRAMAKDRADRPKTMAELAGQFRAALGLAPAQTQNEFAGLSNDFSQPAAPSTEPLHSAQTGAVNEFGQPGRATQSDLHAATVLTVDSAPHEPPILHSGTPLTIASLAPQPLNSYPASQPAAPQVSTPYPQAQPEYVQPAPIQQGISSPQYPVQPIGGVTPKKKHTGIWLLAAAVIVFFVLAAAGGAGWYFLHGSSEPTAKAGDGKTNLPSTTGNSANPAVTDLVHYWVEPTKSTRGVAGTRLTQDVGLNSKDEFRFHFTPQQAGYIYIVGPGQNNVPTTFLTNRPLPESGVKSNQVSINSDFVFPQNGSIGLDEHPGQEVYTVIFSTTQMTQPAFLAAQSEKELKGADRAEFDAMVAKNSANKPTISVNNTDRTAPFASVQVKPADGEAPVVFQIQIQHH